MNNNIQITHCWIGTNKYERECREFSAHNINTQDLLQQTVTLWSLPGSKS